MFKICSHVLECGEGGTWTSCRPRFDPYLILTSILIYCYNFFFILLNCFSPKKKVILLI
jgi:hypothetical protein